MSLMYTIKKVLDPLAAREEEARRRRQRESVPDQNGDDHRFRCRVCGFVSDQWEYCPHCLADTMNQVPP